MSSFQDNQVKKLLKQLFPRGRAFAVSENSIKDKLLAGASHSMGDLVESSNTILYSMFPNSDQFTLEDAELWEQRLGINVNPSASLEDRKAVITQKLNHPGNIMARQSAGYLEQQLRLAGFDVYVHDNELVQSIQQVLNAYYDFPQLGNFQLGQQQLTDVYSYFNGLFSVPQLGNFQLGQQQLNQRKYQNVVINKIDPQKDAGFYWQNIRRSFFIGGPQLGEFAIIPEYRENDFRQLILQLKPIRTVGILLIKYV